MRKLLILVLTLAFVFDILVAKEEETLVILLLIEVIAAELTDVKALTAAIRVLLLLILVAIVAEIAAT